jgi:hypothetical protein
MGQYIEYPSDEYLLGSAKPKAQLTRERVRQAIEARLRQSDPTIAQQINTPPSTHPATWGTKRFLNLLRGKSGKPKSGI